MLYLFCLFYFFVRLTFNVKFAKYLTRVSPCVFAMCCFLCNFVVRCCFGHKLINLSVGLKLRPNIRNHCTCCLIYTLGGSPPKFCVFAVVCLIVTCNILPLLMTFLVFLGVFGVGFAVFVTRTIKEEMKRAMSNRYLFLLCLILFCCMYLQCTYCLCLCSCFVITFILQY